MIHGNSNYEKNHFCLLILNFFTNFKEKQTTCPETSGYYFWVINKWENRSSNNLAIFQHLFHL